MVFDVLHLLLYYRRDRDVKLDIAMRSRASLEQIFGSRIRVRLLKLFLEHPAEHFYVREITRVTRSHLNSVRRELLNLSKVGLVHVYNEAGVVPPRKGNGLQKKYYEVNPGCTIFPELRALLRKAQLLLQEELAREIARAGSVKYLALTGFFVELPGFPTDLLIVGRLSQEKCQRVIRTFEDEFGRTINYTMMTLEEFSSRKEMMDRFLYSFFENKKIVLIDKLPLAARAMGVPVNV